jgi:hypothetical protein
MNNHAAGLGDSLVEHGQRAKMEQGDVNLKFGKVSDSHIGAWPNGMSSLVGAGAVELLRHQPREVSWKQRHSKWALTARCGGREHWSLLCEVHGSR